ncbi:threonine/serine exporter family protein [Peribacillus kribbensis]|uniref:threonine/serine exporter family protein n=1 Tax=Peribacillus kribbensis TaxID=356658 RepID=UPI00041CEEAA|nr:threonine/serine exporter family protein [Peribacillus kribbensis]
MIGQLITSFFATAGIGLIFNIPRRSLISSGIVGMAGWFVYVVLYENDFDAVLATLVSAFFIAIISQYFAKRYKVPVIIFSVGGMIPLVPGGIAYYAMRRFVENNYNEALQLAAKAFMLSGAIAVGIILSEVLNQTIKKLGGR